MCIGPGLHRAIGQTGGLPEQTTSVIREILFVRLIDPAALSLGSVSDRRAVRRRDD